MLEENFTFDFERLKVYQKALSFTNEIFKVTLEFRWEYQDSLGDQFRRAALSVCNNIAEGSQKQGKAKIQFYGFALNSARECVPMISIANTQNQINSLKEKYLQNECIEISKMLYRLSGSVQF